MQETCLRQLASVLRGPQRKLTEDVKVVAQVSFRILNDIDVPINYHSLKILVSHWPTLKSANARKGRLAERSQLHRSPPRRYSALAI